MFKYLDALRNFSQFRSLLLTGKSLTIFFLQFRNLKKQEKFKIVFSKFKGRIILVEHVLFLKDIRDMLWYILNGNVRCFRIQITESAGFIFH